MPGGQLIITTEVENYPGFPKGIQGPELMELFRRRPSASAREIITGDVTAVDLSKRPFTLDVAATSEFTETLADALIIATGAPAKWLGIPSEEKFKELRRLRLRDLRRRVLQGQRRGGRRRRRHRDGRGDLPDALRDAR